jgi:RNase P subunit RPR2
LVYKPNSLCFHQKDMHSRCYTLNSLIGTRASHLSRQYPTMANNRPHKTTGASHRQVRTRTCIKCHSKLVSLMSTTHNIPTLLKCLKITQGTYLEGHKLLMTTLSRLAITNNRLVVKTHFGSSFKVGTLRQHLRNRHINLSLSTKFHTANLCL